MLYNKIYRKKRNLDWIAQNAEKDLYSSYFSRNFPKLSK